MFKKLFDVLRKIIISVLIIYAYNKMALPLDVIIPMNIITILIVCFCGIPGILMLVIFSLFCL